MPKKKDTYNHPSLGDRPIPTANEEALQQPSFDPVTLLATGLSGGIGEVGSQLTIRREALAAADRLFANPEVKAVMSGSGLFAKPSLSHLAKSFGDAFSEDVQGGLVGQGIGTAVAPRHPMVAQASALPAGPSLTRYLMNLLYAVRAAAPKP